MSKEYILKTISYTSESKVSGQPAYKLTFVDPTNLDEYICWVDTANRNYYNNGWDELLNSENALGVYTGLKRAGTTYKGEKKINADSKPVLTDSLTNNQVELLLHKLKEHLSPKVVVNTNNTFSNLFEEVK